LVVDDELAVQELICDALRLAGYEPLDAAHGMEALRVMRESPVDLVILDINMPDMNGYEVLSRMRDHENHTPVIFLTARIEAEDTRRGFQLGADDFVRKPFGIEELMLRVAAVIRRSSSVAESNTTTIGNITLDRDQHTVLCRNKTVDLSPTEFRLLQILMENHARVLTKEQLLESVWGMSGTYESNVVETYISYLRKKFGDDIAIRTVRGVGYQITSAETTL
jgi:two-component system OmpR family response regulator